MENNFRFYLTEFEFNEHGASEDSLNQLQMQADFILPDDYRELMKEFNGGEGEVGENSWLVLLPIEDLQSTNLDYGSLMKQIPDYYLFGKDAADTGYAFNKQDKSIHSFGLMSNFQTDPIEYCGSSMIEFLEYLYNK